MSGQSGEVVEEEETVFIADHDAEQLDTDTDIDSPKIEPTQREHDVCSKPATRTPLFVYLISFFSIIGGFLFGYDTGVIAGALLELEKDFKLDATKKELVVSVTVVAAALGALCGGPSNEKFGRKPTIMIASMTFAVGAVLMGVAPTGGGTENWSWLVVLAGRFIVGLGIGLASMTVPIYLAECSPVHLRGRLTVADNMAVTGGQFVAGVVDYAFSYVSHGWRFMLGIAAIPALVRFVAFFFLPESPRWLVGAGKVSKARGVLQRLRGKEQNIEQELQEIRDDLEQSTRANKRSVFRKLWLMFTTKHLVLALIVGCGLQAIQQLSGINTVMYYAPTILKMAGIMDNHKAIGFGAIIAFGNFIFTLIGMYCVEKSGRRKLILFSLGGVIFSLILLGLAFFLAHSHSPTISSHTPLLVANVSDECLPDSRCGWRNCDDCVIDDACTFCLFNGTFGSGDSTTLCVHIDSPFYDGDARQCQLPEYSVNRSHCSTKLLELPFDQSDVKSTYQYCPSNFSWFTLVALCIYIISFSPGMGPVPWTINAEIFPNWARSIGNSLATTTNWMSNLVVSMTFLHLARYLTRHGTFWLYTGIALLGWIFIFLLLPETKGRSLEQVEELFQGASCPLPGLAHTCQSRRSGYELTNNNDQDKQVLLKDKEEL